ncbi:hypothetical protein F4810DRAFT_685459 [Camillea tinctor]|nr:hypothetical protein F4810DRAFT_685459 [Camillea tinctor]
MFHPLITPLSTYMYTTDIHDNGTVSATDDERLPPGGFSLRHGFPNWFGRRGRRDTVSSRQSGGQQDGRQTPHRPPPADMSSGGTPISKGAAVGDSPDFADTRKREISTFEVLRYIRSTFDDEDVLDSVPLEAAGNPGAWHAWRTHRMDNGKVFPEPASGGNDGGGSGGSSGGGADAGGETASTTAATASPDSARKPGEWNWEGVWEERVKKGIFASLSESVLFGGVGAADDAVSFSLESSVNDRTLADAATQIRFLSMEEDDVEAVKDNLLRTLGHTTA